MRGSVARVALIGIVERLFFTRVAWPRRVLARVLRRATEEIAPYFDAPLYLRQMRTRARLRRATRAPLLHYAALGWIEDKAPNAEFDPQFWRRINPDLPAWRDPLRHFGQRPDKEALPRNEFEAVRVARDSAARGDAVLVIHHARGGGSTRYLEIVEGRLREQGLEPIRLRQLSRRVPVMAWQTGDGLTEIVDPIGDLPALLDKMRAAKVARILVSHIVDMPLGTIDWIIAATGMLGVPYDVMLHDYFVVCPRITLIDDRGTFCGVAPVARCESCVRRGSAEVAGISPAEWRASNRRFLAGARDVFVPSKDTARRIAAATGRLPDVWPPQNDTCWPPVLPLELHLDDTLRVATLGALTYEKGCDVLLGVARAANASGAPIAFTAIGRTSNRRHLRKAGVTVTGPYREPDLPALIRAADPHVVLLPAIWPETWSFVLSHVLTIGLPCVAFDLGAPAERLRKLGRERFLMPPEWQDDPARIVKFLDDLRRHS